MFLQNTSFNTKFKCFQWEGTVQLSGTKGQKFPQGTTGQAQNLAKGRDGLGQPVKIREETQNGTVPDFDSCPVPPDKTGCSKTGKDVLKQEKDVLK